MDNQQNGPTLALLQLATALRKRGRELAATSDLPARKFRRETLWTKETKHCPTPTWGPQVNELRRVTLKRQGALMARLADRIDAALDRERHGFGLPSDWEDTLSEGQALLGQK